MAEVVVEKGGKTRCLLVCSSCARAMRGRYKLQKLKENTDFACAMGSGESALPLYIGTNHTKPQIVNSD